MLTDLNRTNIIKGLYNVLKILLKGKINKDILKNVCSCYAKYKFIKLGKHKERKSKTPFFKWYVKGHSNHSLMYKFIQVSIFKNYEILNKNTNGLYIDFKRFN